MGTGRSSAWTSPRPRSARAGWLAFLRGLVARGLSGVQLVISDAHPGLVAEIGSALRGAAWYYQWNPTGLAEFRWLCRRPSSSGPRSFSPTCSIGCSWPSFCSRLKLGRPPTKACARSPGLGFDPLHLSGQGSDEFMFPTASGSERIRRVSAMVGRAIASGRRRSSGGIGADGPVPPVMALLGSADLGEQIWGYMVPANRRKSAMVMTEVPDPVRTPASGVQPLRR
jgi:hypothetical protein